MTPEIIDKLCHTFLWCVFWICCAAAIRGTRFVVRAEETEPEKDE